MSDLKQVVCCFCGEALPATSSVLLVVYPAPERDESQNLFCHRHCLRSRLSAAIPAHPDLDVDEAPDSQ